MSLEKARQKQLFNWLKQQTYLDKKGVLLSVIFGFLLGLCIVIQAGLLAFILQTMIINHQENINLTPYIACFIITLLARAIILFLRERINFMIGKNIRHQTRRKVLDALEKTGPAYLNQKSTGDWTTLLIEQIENIHDFYARYLPQMRLAMLVPILILIVIFPINWAAATILLATAPLIPIFMILVGMGASDVNKRNFEALSRLSGNFLDRLKGIETIRLFNQGKKQAKTIQHASEDFRIKTMEVLKMAFLSSGVLEFFTSISIAIVAVYFGFSYLGQFEFGSYSLPVTLFAGFFTLILAPEFFQPLRDLGTYYHAKAQAIAAADTLHRFLHDEVKIENREKIKFTDELRSIIAKDLVVMSHDGQKIIGPISFAITSKQKVALIGKSGEGKTSILNVLLGFLPYQGSLKINEIELSDLDLASWHKALNWLGQNPYLPALSIKDNILLTDDHISDEALNQAIKLASLDDVIERLPQGIDTQIGDNAVRLSIGQAQRIAIARTLIKPCQLLLLDEPTASLDKITIKHISQTLRDKFNSHMVITVTHDNEALFDYDQIFILKNKQLNVCFNKEDKS